MKNIYNLRKEVFIFTFIGITAVLIDISTYIFFVSLTKFITFSKFISFIIGASFSYYGNKKFTFKAKTKRITPLFFSGTYLISLLINISINNYSLSLFNYKNYFTILFSLFLSTIFSAIFNFVMMKFFVFKKSR
tara:strand:+ start:109 stop:510 length:402 start_codon:yes stop_codon:yes gene_type:complete